ncbi:hypothetical protein [uncultured Maribacter sp.]|uniref:hypothetical protein n=1 Tax=uncultured Maribacter sp. TaxID=431308 RepID=UPI00263A0003|nr:hypothetical protein [uncultured Maribacter sp.]
MNLLPFEKIEFKSPLKPNHILEIINGNISWNSELGLTFNKNSIKEYEGFTENSSFKIRRILKGGRNSFIPIASGLVSETQNGSKIKLSLSLHKTVLTLAIILTVFSGALVISPFFQSSKYEKEMEELLNNELVKDSLSKADYENFEKISTKEKVNWTAILLFIAPYIMCILFYNFEADIVKEKLNSILQVEK